MSEILLSQSSARAGLIKYGLPVGLDRKLLAKFNALLSPAVESNLINQDFWYAITERIKACQATAKPMTFGGYAWLMKLEVIWYGRPDLERRIAFLIPNNQDWIIRPGITMSNDGQMRLFGGGTDYTRGITAYVRDSSPKVNFQKFVLDQNMALEQIMEAAAPVISQLRKRQKRGITPQAAAALL